MPTRLPLVTRTQACVPQNLSGPFELSCAAIGIATIGLAVFIDWFCNDRTGAALVLLMATVLIGLLRGHSRRRKG